jgi:hypothetical protein
VDVLHSTTAPHMKSHSVRHYVQAVIGRVIIMIGHGIDDLTVSLLIGRGVGIRLCRHVREGPASVCRVPGIISNTGQEASA